MQKNWRWFLSVPWISCSCFFTALAWGGEEVPMNGKYIQDLEKRIERLEKKILPSPGNPFMETLALDLEELSETMETVERKTLMDRLTWGAEFRNRVNWFQYRDRTQDKNLHTDELYQVRLRLNFYADLADNLKFSGRLTGYWNWGDSTGQSQSSGWGPYNKASVPTDTTVRVERAYMDYFFDSLPLCLTIGRQPSAGGPPGELRENRVRKSTWPMLFIDQEQDVVVGTINTSTFLPLEQSNLRLYYFKYHALDGTTLDYKQSGIQNAVSAFGFQFETLLPRMGETLLVGGWGMIKDYTLSRDPSTFDISSSLGAPQGTYLPTVYPEDLGGVHHAHLLLFSKNILDKGIDFFVEWARRDYRPNGQAVQYAVPGISFGLMSDNGTENQTGQAIHTGFRYTAPVSLMKNPKFGFEYVHGTRHWKAFSDGHDDPLDLVGVRGHTYDFYYIQSLNTYLFFRLGTTFIQHNYTSGNSIYGTPQPVDEKVRNLYGLLEMRF